MGNECSGVVVEVGDSIKNFIVGQKVFTRLPTKQIGAFAQYVAVPEDAVAIMPQNLDFIKAAVNPQYYGYTLFQHEQPLHGIESHCHLLTDDVLWANLPDEISVGRYHSWSVREPLPEILEITARADDGTIMAFRHRSLNLRGVQFHPESILTPLGAEIIDNWLSRLNGQMYS